MGDPFFLHRLKLLQKVAAQRKRRVDTDSDGPGEGKDNDNDAMEVQGGDDTVGGKKAKKSVKCAGCSIQITEASSKCKASCCQKQFCSNPACVSMLATHEPLCMEAAKKKKSEKAAAKNALKESDKSDDKTK